MNTVKILKRAIIILIVLFIIFNAFECVEIWYNNWFDENGILIPAGFLSKESAVKNFFPRAFIIGAVRLISTTVNNRIACVIRILSSVVGAFFSLWIPIYAILGELLFAEIGGRGSYEYIATFLIRSGYNCICACYNANNTLLSCKKTTDFKYRKCETNQIKSIEKSV